MDIKVKYRYEPVELTEELAGHIVKFPEDDKNIYIVTMPPPQWFQDKRAKESEMILVNLESGNIVTFGRGAQVFDITDQDTLELYI